MGIRLTSSGYLGGAELDALRTKAEDLIHAGDWAGLLALRAQLEQDSIFWTDRWGPSCALAARLTNQPEAAALLAELVQAGFNQPELFGGELEEAFAGDPRWPEISQAMASASAPLPIALTGWPTLTPAAPLSLFELTGRASELRQLLPPPSPSAWQTARAMLAWVTSRWQHANTHMEISDAVECLRRVDEGARFACVEYSLVLSQALNALCIPSRRVSLRQANYHTGFGRGHVVSEAWIDDLNRWVILDGQNGLYWISEDGAPLGAVELQRLSQAGGPRPDFVPLGADLSAAEADLWFSYFAHVTTTAGTWSQGPFGLVFQRIEMRLAKRVEHRPGALYPDLSELGIETVLCGDQPAVRLITAHPFARGFTVDGTDLESDILTLDSAPGHHEHALAARTDYGTLRPQALRYTVALTAGAHNSQLCAQPIAGNDLRQSAQIGGYRLSAARWQTSERVSVSLSAVRSRWPWQGPLGQHRLGSCRQVGRAADREPRDGVRERRRGPGRPAVRGFGSCWGFVSGCRCRGTGTNPHPGLLRIPGVRVPDSPAAAVGQGHRGHDELAARIALVARGDVAAFGAVYDQIADPVFGIVCRVLCDPAQSEEVTQDVLLEVWRTAAHFDAGKGSAMAWVATLAHRRAVDRIRSVQKQKERERRSTTADIPYDTVADAVETTLERERVRRCLGALIEVQRERSPWPTTGATHTPRSQACSASQPAR